MPTSRPTTRTIFRPPAGISSRRATTCLAIRFSVSRVQESEVKSQESVSPAHPFTRHPFTLSSCHLIIAKQPLPIDRQRVLGQHVVPQLYGESLDHIEGIAQLPVRVVAR